MNPVIGLSLGRIAVGALALASPDVAAKLFQLDPTTNPQVPYVAGSSARARSRSAWPPCWPAARPGAT